MLVRVHMDKEEWFWNIFDFYFLFGVLKVQCILYLIL